MTELNEQELNQLIDRILAGEPLASLEIEDSELAGLVALAAELREARAEPDAAFLQRLQERLDSMGANADVARAGVRQTRWLPAWFTWRRAAAVAATLVLGLGVAGMTRAVISGNGPTDGDSMIISETDSGEQDRGASLDSMEAVDDVAAPEDTNGTSAGNAATEPLPGGVLTAPELRRVIKTADYEVEVPVGDFQDRYDEVAAIAARYGGYVISSDSSVSDSDDDQLKQGTITIRVANTGDSFSQAQKDIEGLGKVLAKQVSGDDVTEEYVDLQSRLRNAESQQASLLALMQKAATIEEILMVQTRLDDVQLQIEQLKGSIAYMESMTDYASITVELREEDVEAAVDDGDDGIDWGFIEAVKYAGWLAVQTVNFVIIALGVIIPAVLIAALVILAGHRLLLRRRNRD
ncbi:MAG: DUF4349 domain-containing protein [Thermoleophilia bacterium]